MPMPLLGSSLVLLGLNLNDIMKLLFMHVVLGVEVRGVGEKLDLTLITRNISMPNVLLVTQ